MIVFFLFFICTISSLLQWAVEIARQKVYGTRPICPIEVIEPKDTNLCNRILPERKAAAKAKERFKELRLHDEAKGPETREDSASTESESPISRHYEFHDEFEFDSVSFIEYTKNIENRRGNKNSKQLNMKLGRNKALRLNRRDKALIKKFKIKPCIVCIPALKDIRKVMHKLKEQKERPPVLKDIRNVMHQLNVTTERPPVLKDIRNVMHQLNEPTERQSAVNVNTKYTGVNKVNKRKSKKPKRIIKPGQSGWDPIVVSDDDSDIECLESNLPSLTRNQNSPIVIGYDSEDDDDDDLISIPDSHEYTGNNDPNDADTEEDAFDFMDDVYDSFDENSDVCSVSKDDYNEDSNDTDDEHDSNDDDDEEEEDDYDDYENGDDDDALAFSKTQCPTGYGGIRGKTIIAPASFQPTKFKVAPPKFMLPPTFRDGTFLDS